MHSLSPRKTLPALQSLLHFTNPDINKIGKGYSRSTLTFLRCSSHHITGVDVSGATKEIKNATIISKAITVS
jgi:hypothetical protein